MTGGSGHTMPFLYSTTCQAVAVPAVIKRAANQSSRDRVMVEVLAAPYDNATDHSTSTMMIDPHDDSPWSHWKSHFLLAPGVIYLNHGSFGPPPRRVREARQKWQDAIDSQPMQF